MQKWDICSVLVFIIFVIAIIGCERHSDKEDLNPDTNEIPAQTQLNVHLNVQDLTKLLRSYRFHEAHLHLLRCIKSGDNEARFELAKTLLIELSWADRMTDATNSGNQLPASIRKKIGPDPIYSVFRTNSYGILVLQTNSLGNLPLSTAIMQIWHMANYPKLISDQLGMYIDAENARNRPVAQQWKKFVDSAIEHGLGNDILYETAGKPRGYTREEWTSIGATASIMTHIDIDNITIGALPIK